MNNGIKNVIGVVAIVATLAFAYASYMFVQVYDRSSEPTNFRSFYVQAEGESVGVPDVAQFSFQVISQGDTDVANTQQENTEKMNKVLAYIDSEGVDKKDIKTLQYSIQPRYSTTRCRYEEGKVCPPPAIVGYTVQQSAVVKIRDFSKISSLLSEVVKNGANSVSQLSFTIDDLTQLQNEARAQAIQKAKEKAQLIAKEGGFSVGRLLEINENFIQPQMYARGGMEMAVSMDMDEKAPTPTIEPGSQEIKVNINMRYEIN